MLLREKPINNSVLHSLSQNARKNLLLPVAFLLVALVPAIATAATINISSPTVVEGDAGTTTVTFNITCDPCTSVNAIVGWSTMDGTATVADNDYVAKSGTIDDLGNGTAIETYPVVVTVNGDTNAESDETFSLKITSASVGCPSLSGPGGCPTPPTSASGTATIQDDGDAANDPPSIVADNASVTVNEGQTAANTGTFSDAQGEGTVTLSASVGSVVSGAGTWSWSLGTNDGPDDSQTVTITATDDQNETATVDFALTVNNVAPAVSADNALVTVDEGQTAANTGSFSDPGDDTVSLSASVGAVTDEGGGNWSWSFGTSDGPDDSQTVTITATDSDGATGSTDFELVVNNVAPSIFVDNASVTVDEGMTAANTGTFSDPGADTVSLSASVGSVTDEGSGNWSWSFDTVDGPADSQTVTISAIDSDGAANDVDFGLTVNNVAPTVSVPQLSDEPSNEGDAVTVDANFSDPAGAADEPYTCTVDYGDGSAAMTGTVSGFNCSGSSYTYADNDSYSVEICVTDKDGAQDCNSSTHVVDNVDPSIGVSTNSAEQCGDTPEGGTVDVSADFSDPGFDNLAVAGTLEDFDNSSIDWGDGAVEPALVSESPGSAGTASTGTVSGSHNYASGGIYTIIITVEDDDGGVDSTSLTALVTGAGLGLDGTLGVIGSNAKDVININLKQGDIEVKAGFLGAGKATFPNVSVDQLHVIACDGNDQIHVNHQVGSSARLEGNAGNDHITSGNGASVVEGGSGADQLSGGDADDTLLGGEGNDHLRGGKGNDSLSGDEGNDNLTGQQGNDALDGGAGNDNCNGGPGSDTQINCE